MKYPINYDFGKNWNKIAQHLDKPIIQKAIKKGVNDYLSRFSEHFPKYNFTEPPANQSSCDYYFMTMERLYDETIDAAFDAGMAPKELVAIEKKIRKAKDPDDHELQEEWFKVRKELYDYLFPWSEIKYKIQSYVFLRACHWWAPTFLLEMAKLVEPDEKWYIRTSDKHTTVINKKHTKIFDIVYWSLGGRLENYLFGDPIDVKDKTLGGKDAFLDSAEDAVDSDDD